jgi:hypothetical protein
MALVSIQSGASCLLWDDLWLGQVPKHAFPELYSFAKKPNLTLEAAKSSQSLLQDFHLPLSAEAYQQFLQLEESVNNFQPTGSNDTWSYIWGRQNFSCAKAYKHLSGSAWVHPVFRWIWKSSCQHKHKVFFWLLAQDRLSTRNILRRKHMFLQSYNCALCNDSAEETVDHLFLHCGFAKNCWNLIGLTVPHSQGPFQTLEAFRTQLNVPFFMEIIIIMCWSIWTVRNNLIFRGDEASTQQCKHIFRSIFDLVTLRAKKKYFPQISLWLEQLV